MVNMYTDRNKPLSFAYNYSNQKKFFVSTLGGKILLA